MDTLFFIIMAAMVVIIIAVIIKMVVNRLNGKDELEGLVRIKKRRNNK